MVISSASYGSYTFIGGVFDQAARLNWDFHSGVVTTTVHELTHLLLNEKGTNGFDQGEHVVDPSTTDLPGGLLDDPYIMIADSTFDNFHSSVLGCNSFETEH